MSKLKMLGTLCMYSVVRGAKPTHTFDHICGNYCGGSWCNAKILGESKCDYTVPPADDPNKPGTPSCADACCRGHDRCCGQGDRATCNTIFVQCLNECSEDNCPCVAGGDDGCFDTFTISKTFKTSLIKSTFKYLLNDGYCCGSRCPSNVCLAPKGNFGPACSSRFLGRNEQCFTIKVTQHQQGSLKCQVQGIERHHGNLLGLFGITLDWVDIQSGDTVCKPAISLTIAIRCQGTVTTGYTFSFKSARKPPTDTVVVKGRSLRKER